MGLNNYPPGSTCDFAAALIASMTMGKGSVIDGLPPHLRVVNKSGEPSNSTRREFGKGKASKKKRGK